jgi:hypothetical protein
MAKLREVCSSFPLSYLPRHGRQGGRARRIGTFVSLYFFDYGWGKTSRIE